MTRLFRPRKTDSTQAEIKSGLEKAGVRVWIIEEPCDLLTYFFCRKHDKFCWQTLEAKPLTGKKAPKARIRSDQPEQNQFLADTHTPVVTNAIEALLALSIHD
jgi:hypothetical protein